MATLAQVVRRRGVGSVPWPVVVASFLLLLPLLVQPRLGAVTEARPHLLRFAPGLDEPANAPVFKPDSVSSSLREEFERKNYKLDERSGNYLSPKVFAKTRRENLVPVLVNGKYVKDLRGQTVFLRESIRAKLLAADEAMFKKKQKHIAINYGFRSNALQHELFRKLNGRGKVAPAGHSFHETGMALDLHNWRDAQRFMIEAGSAE